MRHEWDDEWFKEHGKDLYDAMAYIQAEYQIRTGRVIHLKEKYGTIRWEYTYATFWNAHKPIYDYFKPGYLFYKWPKWFSRIDYFLGRRIPRWVQTYYFHKHAKVLVQVLKEAAVKYIQIEDEVFADFKDFIKVVEEWDEK